MEFFQPTGAPSSASTIARITAIVSATGPSDRNPTLTMSRHARASTRRRTPPRLNTNTRIAKITSQTTPTLSRNGIRALACRSPRPTTAGRRGRGDRSPRPPSPVSSHWSPFTRFRGPGGGAASGRSLRVLTVRSSPYHSIDSSLRAPSACISSTMAEILRHAASLVQLRRLVDRDRQRLVNSGSPSNCIGRPLSIAACKVGIADMTASTCPACSAWIAVESVSYP